MSNEELITRIELEFNAKKLGCNREYFQNILNTNASSSDLDFIHIIKQIQCCETAEQVDCCSEWADRVLYKDIAARQLVERVEKAKFEELKR